MLFFLFVTATKLLRNCRNCYETARNVVADLKKILTSSVKSSNCINVNKLHDKLT